MNRRKIGNIEKFEVIELFQKILAEYRPGYDYIVDGKLYCGGETELHEIFSDLDRIEKIINFEIKKTGQSIIRFHDSPEELIFEISEEPFFKKLAIQGFLVYTLTDYTEPTYLQTVGSFLFVFPCAVMAIFLLIFMYIGPVILLLWFYSLMTR